MRPGAPPGTLVPPRPPAAAAGLCYSRDVDDVNQGGFVWSRDDRLTAIVGVVLLGLLYLARLHSYLLFHTLAETVFIVVCLTVLIIAWSLRQFLDDDFAVFLGVALGSWPYCTSLHVVDYPGVV